jgi:hypothetical protein
LIALIINAHPRQDAIDNENFVLYRCLVLLAHSCSPAGRQSPPAGPKT